MRVAIVHDWLVTRAGAERVLERILYHFPNAQVYTLLKQRNSNVISVPTKHPIKTSFVQYLPTVTDNYRLFAWLMPRAIEQLELKTYDLIISSSWAFSHGIVKKKISCKHLAYVHTPMRWAWDMEMEYLKNHSFPTVLSKVIQRQIHNLREWDKKASRRPNKILANSKFVQRRIKKCWHEDSSVVYPPVYIPKIKDFEAHGGFVSICRLVPYKKVDLIIRAFTHLPSKKLFIAGSGPELDYLKRIAPKNVAFLGYLSDDEKIKLMLGSKGLIQASKEDFGISVVESQACGIPVLAFREGGASETVIDIDREKTGTGLLFNTECPKELAKLIEKFSKMNFNPIDCKKNALQFSQEF